MKTLIRFFTDRDDQIPQDSFEPASDEADYWIIWWLHKYPKGKVDFIKV